MSDLIDREALKDAVKRYAGEPIKKKDRKCQSICLDMLGTIDAQPTAPRWHRVEEPPKTHMWCFVYTDEPDMIMPIRIAFYTASCTGKGSWYHYESGSDITDEVDYWTEMNLEGPKLDHDLPWPIEPPKEDA